MSLCCFGNAFVMCWCDFGDGLLTCWWCVDDVCGLNGDALVMYWSCICDESEMQYSDEVLVKYLWHTGIFSPEGNLDWRRGWGWGGNKSQKNTKKYLKTVFIYILFLRKGTLTAAGDGEGIVFVGGNNKFERKIEYILYYIMYILYLYIYICYLLCFIYFIYIIYFIYFVCLLWIVSELPELKPMIARALCGPC